MAFSFADIFTTRDNGSALQSRDQLITLDPTGDNRVLIRLLDLLLHVDNLSVDEGDRGLEVTAVWSRLVEFLQDTDIQKTS